MQNLFKNLYKIEYIMISLKSIQMTNKKGDSQSSSSNDKPAEAKNRGWPKGKRRYPKVNIIKRE